MRTVSLEIVSLGLKVGDTILLELVDSVGNTLVSTSGYALKVSIELSTDTFTYDLLETQNINQLSYYKLTLPNTLSFNFTIPNASDDAHDLLSLLSIGCFDGIIKEDGNRTRLDSRFLEKLNLYFTGENPHFNNTEQDLVNLYEYYADEIKETINTIDIMRLMDEYLATIGV